PYRRPLGVVFQDSRLFAHLPVRENLRFGLRRAGGGVVRITEDAVIGSLGLEKLLDRSPEGLSGGERQRVAIGRALLAQPRLLLLDEPLAALDQERRDEVLPFLQRLQHELDIPQIYVSPQLEEVIRLADTLILLENG